MVGHMTDYWRNHPPVHVLVAGYIGYKAAPSISDAPALESNLSEIAADLRDDLPEHLRHALDAFTSVR